MSEHKMKRLRLNLGCGDKILPDYVNIDVAASRRGAVPDVLSDLRNLPFTPESVDEILSVHVIEHFYYWEAAPLLSYWRTLLKPEGRVIIECPNLLTAARALVADESLASNLSGKRGQHVMWPLYGDPGWQDELMCHRWGYTPASLIALLRECGFQNARQEPAEFKKGDPRDMRVTGTK